MIWNTPAQRRGHKIPYPERFPAFRLLKASPKSEGSLPSPMLRP